MDMSVAVALVWAAGLFGVWFTFRVGRELARHEEDRTPRGNGVNFVLKFAGTVFLLGVALRETFRDDGWLIVVLVFIALVSGVILIVLAIWARRGNLGARLGTAVSFFVVAASIAWWLLLQ